MQLPECVLVNPWGVQVKPLVAIEMARPLYGSLKGKNFRIWIDRIRINQISEEVWAVQFDKWLKSGTWEIIPLLPTILVMKLWKNGLPGAGHRESATEANEQIVTFWFLDDTHALTEGELSYSLVISTVYL